MGHSNNINRRNISVSQLQVLQKLYISSFIHLVELSGRMGDSLFNGFSDNSMPKYMEGNGRMLPASFQNYHGGSSPILNEDPRMETLLSLFVVFQLMVNRHPMSKRFYDELCTDKHGTTNQKSCNQKVFDQLQAAQEKMNTLSKPLYTSNIHFRNKRSPARTRYRNRNRNRNRNRGKVGGSRAWKNNPFSKLSAKTRQELKGFGVTGAGETKGPQRIYHEINTSDNVKKAELWTKIFKTKLKNLPCGINGCNKPAGVFAHFDFSNKMSDPVRVSCLGPTCKMHNNRWRNNNLGQNIINLKTTGKGKGQWIDARPQDAQEFNGEFFTLDKVMADLRTNSNVVANKGRGKGNGSFGDGFNLTNADWNKKWYPTWPKMHWAPVK